MRNVKRIFFVTISFMLLNCHLLYSQSTEQTEDDSKIKKFCAWVQGEIDDLPFLDSVKKQKAKSWLDECVNKSKKSSDHKSVFNNEYDRFRQRMKKEFDVDLPAKKVS